MLLAFPLNLLLIDEHRNVGLLQVKLGLIRDFAFVKWSAQFLYIWDSLYLGLKDIGGYYIWCC